MKILPILLFEFTQARKSCLLNYFGDVTRTVSGRECQYWDENYPHEPKYTPKVTKVLKITNVFFQKCFLKMSDFFFRINHIINVEIQTKTQKDLGAIQQILMFVLNTVNQMTV